MATNDPKKRQIELVCNAFVKAAYLVRPGAVNFGRIKRGDGPQRKTVKITSKDAGPLSPEVVPPKKGNLAVTLRTVKPGEAYELEVVVTPKAAGGRIRDKVLVKTGIARIPELDIPVYANVLPRVAASPAVLTFPPKSEKAVAKTIRFNWDNDKPGSILKAKCNDPNLNVRLDEQDGQGVVVVEAQAGYKPPGGAALIVIETDDPEVAQLTVRVRLAKMRPPGRRGARAAKHAGKPRTGPTARKARIRNAPSRGSKKAPQSSKEDGDPKPTKPSGSPSSDGQSDK